MWKEIFYMKSQDMLDLTQQIIEYSITAIKYAIVMKLSDFSYENTINSLRKDDTHVIVHMEKRIAIEEYDEIVEESLNNQLTIIFDKFLLENQEFCINVCNNVYSLVKDKSIDNIIQEVLDLKDKYLQIKS